MTENCNMNEKYQWFETTSVLAHLETVEFVFFSAAGLLCYFLL